MLSYTFEQFFLSMTPLVGFKESTSLKQTISGSNLATTSNGADSSKQRTSLPISTLVDLKKPPDGKEANPKGNTRSRKGVSWRHEA